MFTNNAKAFLDIQSGFNTILKNRIIAPDATEIASVYSYSNYNIFDTMKKFPSKSIEEYGYEYSTNARAGVVFGTGTGVPSINDTSLFGKCITSISSSNTTYVSSSTVDEEQDLVHYQTIYTISNTTGSDLTIGEVGLTYEVVTRKNNTNTGSNDKQYGILFEHSVLDTPITIPAGGVGQVTYIITMHYPTSV